MLALLELPSISTLIHVARLRHLLSCFRTPVSVMWALLHWQSNWLSAVRTSLAWLWACIDGGKTHASWELAWQEWHIWCREQPRRWKSLVRRAQTQACFREAWTAASEHHLGLIGRQLRLAGASLPIELAAGLQPLHCCAPCQATFRTYQGWAVHAFKRHGRVGEYRQVQTGLQCQACLRHFPTHIKLCRHLQYHPACRHSLQARGFHCLPEPGIGSKRAPDDGKFQAPPLQALGPALSPQEATWDGYLDRPSVEVIECLRHVAFDCPIDELSDVELWDRVRIAFASVCLPNLKIVVTVQTWIRELETSLSGHPATLSRLLDIAGWILQADLAGWLVPAPAGKLPQVCTFRDAALILHRLDCSGLRLPPTVHSDEWTFVRVGDASWLSTLCGGSGVSVDFSHEECLAALSTGCTPSFFEDDVTDVAFVLSAAGLPGWDPRPISPLRQRDFASSLARATLAGDLFRLALRLWLRGSPALLMCEEDSGILPSPFPSLPGLDSCRVGSTVIWRTVAFDWELSGFTFS